MKEPEDARAKPGTPWAPNGGPEMVPCWRPSDPAPDRKNHGNYKVWGQKLGSCGEAMETNSRGAFLGVFRSRLGSFREALLGSWLATLLIFIPLRASFGSGAFWLLGVRIQMVSTCFLNV